MIAAITLLVRRRAALLAAAVAVALLAGCGRNDKSAAPAIVPLPPPPAPAAAAVGGAGIAANMDVAQTAPLEKKAAAPRHRGRVAAKEAAALDAERDLPAAPPSPEPGPAQNAAPTRAWFPETFLFAPSVITDAAGKATLDVLVPDRLTTWRVLALAHSRAGAQAGAVTTMQSQLPASIDLVVPHFLVAGDHVALPLQITNTTEAARTEVITAKVEGGTLSRVPASLRADASSTASATAWLDTPSPGEVVVQADAGGDDSVRRTISVKSPGRPMHVEAGGTLAVRRAFDIELPGGAPLPASARVSLQVFPGALALLRAELASAPDRAGLDDDAYLLALVGRARELSARLGAPVDKKTLTHLSRIAAQRLARRALNPDPIAAAALAPGALASPGDGLIGRSGEHLAALVARSQRPDGTFGGGDGWPVPRLLVATADGIAAVRAAASADGADDEDNSRAAAATLRARGAFERYAGQIHDPYTAAVVAQSGVVGDDLLKKLRKQVMDALVQHKDGTRVLPVPAGAQRSDGAPPSEIEATAVAVLALHAAPEASALLPDLGAALLSAYRPGSGFGDGRTNRAALDAVALLFAQPLPSKVTVSLAVDGKSVGTDTLTGARLHEVMTLDGPVEPAKSKDGAPARVAVVVEADPPLPGLSYVLAVDYAVPWPAPPPDAGLTLDVNVDKALAVGKAAKVELRAVAPGGAALHVVQGLPAGVDPVRSSLEALVQDGVIDDFDVTDGVVTLNAPARGQGELFDARYEVVPTLAGALHARVASVSLRNAPSTEVFFPPSTWKIAP